MINIRLCNAHRAFGNVSCQLSFNNVPSVRKTKLLAFFLAIVSSPLTGAVNDFVRNVFKGVSMIPVLCFLYIFSVSEPPDPNGMRVLEALFFELPVLLHKLPDNSSVDFEGFELPFEVVGYMLISKAISVSKYDVC